MRIGQVPITPSCEPLSPVISLVGASKRYQDATLLGMPSGDKVVVVSSSSNTNVRVFQQQADMDKEQPESFDP